MTKLIILNKKTANIEYGGHRFCIQWNDKSKSCYKTKKIAISEMRKDIAQNRK